eukprot:1161944-Pelagomonas_calceolata.AAC.3
MRLCTVSGVCNHVAVLHGSIAVFGVASAAAAAAAAAAAFSALDFAIATCLRQVCTSCPRTHHAGPTTPHVLHAVQAAAALAVSAIATPLHAAISASLPCDVMHSVLSHSISTVTTIAALLHDALCTISMALPHDTICPVLSHTISTASTIATLPHDALGTALTPPTPTANSFKQAFKLPGPPNMLNAVQAASTAAPNTDQALTPGCSQKPAATAAAAAAARTGSWA